MEEQILPSLMVDYTECCVLSVMDVLTMYTLASFGAALVPMAIPLTCVKEKLKGTGKHFSKNRQKQKNCSNITDNLSQNMVPSN